MGARRVPGLNKLVFLQSMNTQKGMRQGGRKKGTPNKPKAIKVVARIVDEYTEYFNTRTVLPSATPGQRPGTLALMANAGDADRVKNYLLACVALELMKQGEQRV